jgi:hypothetical protein
LDGQKIKIIDKVHYIIPFGILGQIANALLVRKRLDYIYSVETNYLLMIYSFLQKMQTALVPSSMLSSCKTVSINLS